MKPASNILLTGELSSGKSSIVRNVLHQLSIPVRGFFSQTIVRNNDKVGYGFKVVGESSMDVFAHVDFQSGNRLGKFRLNLAPFERAAAYIEKSLKLTPSLFVIDEIGIIEKNVARYRKAVVDLLDSSVPSLVVVQKRATWFLEKIHERNDVTLFELEQNHNLVQDKILNILKEITNANSGVDAECCLRNQIQHRHEL